MNRKPPSQEPQQGGRGIVLGVYCASNSTTCVSVRFPPVYDSGDCILGRAICGSSNYINVGECAAKDNFEKVLNDVIVKSYSEMQEVHAVCVALSDCNPRQEDRIKNWVSKILPATTRVYVHDACAADLCSGTMGQLHGCVLLSGYGFGSVCYGRTEDGMEYRTDVGRPRGSAYAIGHQGMLSVVNAYTGGRPTLIIPKIKKALSITSYRQIPCWAYEVGHWAENARLVAPIVVEYGEAGDEVARDILAAAVEDLAGFVKSVIRKLKLCGKDKAGSCPVVMVGDILEAAYASCWDPAKEVMEQVNHKYPGAYPIKPKVEPAAGAALLAASRCLKEEDGEARSPPKMTVQRNEN